MSFFKLNQSDILSKQDWAFPTNIAVPLKLKSVSIYFTNNTLIVGTQILKFTNLVT